MVEASKGDHPVIFIYEVQDMQNFNIALNRSQFISIYDYNKTGMTV